VNPNQKCTLPTVKASKHTGVYNRSTAGRLNELTTPLYSALVGSHLGNRIQFWDKCKDDIDNWSRFCKGPPVIRRLQHFPCVERLKELGLFSLEKRRIWGTEQQCSDVQTEV